MEKANKKILVIDDELDVTKAVRLTITLQEPNWQVIEANNGEKGLVMVDAEKPDLVLLDLQMPDMSGFDVLKELRLFSDVPVIILTVEDDELAKVHGLELGADDYIVKPFGHLELLARIRSVLRRTEGTISRSTTKPYQYAGLRIDFQTRQVYRDGKPVSLTATEFRLLEVLAQNAGWVVTPDALLGKVWGHYATESTDYLKVYVHRLRQKIEPDPAHPQFLHTARGEGYWFAPPEESQGGKVAG
ncbi:MAG TPA: response regulator transcription factor [Anaerolineae bacterium]|nr:response regulator transcription factor [Anaerolineae bacterium]